MRTTEEVIGPEQAAKYLERNVQNRPLRNRTVKVYSEVMRRGGWKFTPEAIYFDEAGNLLNGQHRLHAVVDSGTTQRFTVVRGVSRDLYEVIDGGAKRSDADRLHDAGIVDSNVTSVALKYLIWYERCPEIKWRGGGSGVTNKTLTASDLIALAREIGEDSLIYATGIGRRARTRAVQLNGNAAAAAALLILAADPEGELRDRFWDGVLTGVGLTATDPRMALRNWALGGTKEQGNHGGQLALHALLKAWNAFARRQPIRKIRIMEGERMPDVVVVALAEKAAAAR